MTEQVTQEEELQIEVDGVKYKVNKLPAAIKELIGMHQKWNNDLMEATDRVNQLRAATQQLSTQVIEQIREEAKKEQSESVSGAAVKDDGVVAGGEPELSLE